MGSTNSVKFKQIKFFALLLSSLLVNIILRCENLLMKVDSFSWNPPFLKLNHKKVFHRFKFPTLPRQCSNFPHLGMDDNQMPMDRQGRGGGGERGNEGGRGGILIETAESDLICTWMMANNWNFKITSVKCYTSHMYIVLYVQLLHRK